MTETVVPTFTVLVRVISALLALAIYWAMDRPNPDPPVALVRDESTR